MFGRAAIRLGIGPHSSLSYFTISTLLLRDVERRAVQFVAIAEFLVLQVLYSTKSVLD